MKFNLILILLVLFTATAAISMVDDPEESKARGEEVYNSFCVTCHLDDGKGIEGVYPPLAGSDFLLNDPKRSIHALKYGLFSNITVNGVEYNTAMPALGLSDQEIADVMNYILNTWGNKGDYITAEVVRKVEE